MHRAALGSGLLVSVSTGAFFGSNRSPVSAAPAVAAKRVILVRLRQQRGPGSWPDNAIRHKAVIALELANGSLGHRVEDPARRHSDLDLNFVDRITGFIAPTRGSPAGIRRGQRACGAH